MATPIKVIASHYIRWADAGRLNIALLILHLRCFTIVKWMCVCVCPRIWCHFNNLVVSNLTFIED